MAQNFTFNLVKNAQGNIQSGANSSGLILLKRTNFATAALGQTTGIPEIVQQSADTTIRAVVVNHLGNRVLRHNLNTVDTGVDPISGQQREGNFTHYFNAGSFYNPATTPQVTLKIKHRFDYSYCRSNQAAPGGPFPYPEIDGKYFLLDQTVDSLAMYLGLKNSVDTGSVRIVSGNNGSGYWAPQPDGGWCDFEPYGWKDLSNNRVNSLNLTPADKSGGIFRTDGQFHEFTIEMIYNPGNIGYNLMRIKSSSGSICHDIQYNNTDVNGFFPVPLIYKLKGCRIYSNPIAFTTGRQDVTTNPEIYTGYCGGYDIEKYELSSGVII